MLNRRKFILLATTAVVMPSLLALAADLPTATRIWSDGTILTMNDRALRAEAVAENSRMVRP